LTARREWWIGRKPSVQRIAKGVLLRVGGDHFTPGTLDKVAMKQAMSTGLPRWLKPIDRDILRKQVRAAFAAADKRNREADRIYWGGRLTDVTEMTAAQKRAELDRQYRRLSGLDYLADAVEIEVNV
jgi:hypothetical protein